LRLEITVDVGEAVAAWLAGGRPPGAACPALFVRLRPPHGRLASTSVSDVVRRACARAGIPAAGAHRLRHFAAAGMLAAGGTLAEIGQVLRHAQAGTTAIYAKADVLALSPLARPWPGGPR
jgi:integrase/recombinase XerD